MNKLYQYLSIIFRVLYFIGGLAILALDFAFSGLTEENDYSLIPRYVFCALCIFIITLFHKVTYGSVWSKVLQILTFSIILVTLIGCIYLSIVILQNDGSALALVWCVMLALISLPLSYFVVRNRKYSHYC